MSEETEILNKIILDHLVKGKDGPEWKGVALTVRGIQRLLESHKIRLTKSQITQRYATFREKFNLSSTHYNTKKGVLTGLQISELTGKTVTGLKELLGQLPISKPGANLPPLAIREVSNHARKEKIDGKWRVFE